MRSKVASFFAVVCLGLAALAPVGHSQSTPAVRSQAELKTQFTGRWQLAISRDQAVQRIAAGTERAVTEMNALLQGITRSQIRERNPPNSWFELSFAQPDRILVTFDTNYSYDTHAGHAQDTTTRDGTDVNVNQYFRGEQLEQVFAATMGRRWNVMTVSPDGRSLTLNATIQGPMMPVPVAYSLPYRKAG
jgi:hypothetical protein